MRTQIAVGVIYNETGDKVLLALRPESAAQGGLWEFPGGKVNPGEDIDQALARELEEELGLRVVASRPLITIDHDYPDSAVTLRVFSVTRWYGSAAGREGQPIEWVPLDDLPAREFPEANRAVVTAARLPALYLITPDLSEYGVSFLDDLDGILRAGVRLLQFRCKTRNLRDNEPVLQSIMDVCREYKCRCIVNGTPDVVIRYGCDGVHLTSDLLLNLDERPLPRHQWVAASCHNREELNHACRIGVDFAVLAPVRNTASHTGVKPLGWDTFASLARGSTVPVFALGGMRGSELSTSLINGGQGIAMISGIWEARDKSAAVRRILEQGG